jgi:hypothetical protein
LVILIIIIKEKNMMQQATMNKLQVNYIDEEISAPLDLVLKRETILSDTLILGINGISEMFPDLKSVTIRRDLSDKFIANASNDFSPIGGGRGQGYVRIAAGETETHRIGFVLWYQDKEQTKKTSWQRVKEWFGRK